MVSGHTKIRVLIADDHVAMREGLSSILSQETGFEVVGKARDGLEAVQLARDMRPDAILMDLSMPRLEGIEAARIIHQDYPKIRIIILSVANDANDSSLACSKFCWAAGVINKAAPLADLLKALRQVRA